MTNPVLLFVLRGANTMGFAIASCFFLRFWHRTADRLFLAFSVAFAVLALGQVLEIIAVADGRQESSVYLTRLFAFTLIIAAIIAKNMLGRRKW